MEKSAENIKSFISDLPALQVLEQKWLTLENQSDCTFFLSWAWIGTWLSLLPETVKLKLFEAQLEGETVGLAVIGEQIIKRSGFVTACGWYLNETGISEYDELTIEHNDILSKNGLIPEVRKAFVECCKANSNWNELYLDGADPAWVNVLGTSEELTVSENREEPNCYIDLTELTPTKDGYVSELGKNTRHLVRRTRKWYEKEGEIKLTIAATVEEALGYLSELKKYHQKLWSERGQPGSFASSYFEEFHQELIKRRFAHGEIQLIEIKAGNLQVGYLYNFVYRGCAYSYQSGFNYIEKRNKPGLLSYVLLVDKYLTTDLCVFDLLAGGEYKERLAKGKRTMNWLVVQRDNFVFKIERFLKAIKRRIFS